jgi:hypothetical protein
MSTQPSSTGRDSAGRFAPGNPGGPGNLYARFLFLCACYRDTTAQTAAGRLESRLALRPIVSGGLVAEAVCQALDVLRAAQLAGAARGKLWTCCGGPK